MRGVSKTMILTNIKPFNYVILLFNLLIGLVNKVWEHFTEWLDNEIDNLDNDKMDVQNIAKKFLVKDNILQCNLLEETNSIRVKSMKVNREYLKR